MLIVPILLLANITASADDGDKTLKVMSHNAKVTVEPESVGLTIPESEHAFIDMMKFYVPAQAASGAIALGDYYNADGAFVEGVGVAKPLVSVFIHGPAIGVGDLPFAHSFMDAFAAVSLDDGVTWKTTNLSDSADQSSFRLGQSGGGQHANDHGGDDDGSDHHTTPGPTITKAKYEDDKDGTLEVEGKDALAKATVTIINSLTKEELATTRADKDGDATVEQSLIILVAHTTYFMPRRATKYWSHGQVAIVSRASPLMHCRATRMIWRSWKKLSRLFRLAKQQTVHSYPR